MNYRAYCRKYYELANKMLHWWINELIEIFNSLKYFKKISVLHYEINKNGGMLLKDDKANHRISGTYNIVLIINDNSILYRKVKLPNAARKNIDKVVNYEFSKYFPLNIEDAIVSYTVVQSSVNKGSVEVEIWVVGKKMVDRCLNFIRKENNIEIKKLSIINGDGLDVITHDVLNAKIINRRPTGSWYLKNLNIAIMVLLLSILVYPVLKMEIYFKNMEEKVKILEKEAQPIIIIREKILENDRRLVFLIDKKMQSPDVAYIWSRLTNSLADIVILSRMQINKNRVKIEGKALSVEKIIKKLESNAEFSDVKIDGSVGPAPALAGKSRYETMKISMSINK